MSQGFALGIVATIVAYVLFRSLAKALLSPWMAGVMDRRAMIARAESDALQAARQQFEQTVERWHDSRATEEA